MSVIGSNALAGASGAGGAAAGYQIDRSLRFSNDDSAYLSRTPSSAGNRRTFTLSCWVKRSGLGTEQSIFSAAATPGSLGSRALFRFENDELNLGLNPTGSSWVISNTDAVFKDVSAWYHVVLVVDTTQATSTDRVNIYVNGVAQTLTGSFPALNQDLSFNASGSVHTIGNFAYNSTAYFDGYLAEIHFVDGQALAATDFGESDANTGAWNPIAYSGTYGTNGFYLNFSDNTSTTTIAEDSSGNNNDWTANNIAVAAADNNWADYVYASDSTYSNTATGTNFFTGAGSQENLFDGSTSTQVGSENVNMGWVYFRPATAITGVTSLRIWGHYNSTTRINGTDYQESPAWSSTAQWVSVPSPPSSITEIAIQGSAARISAIEVNGAVLVDPVPASAVDSLIDTPTDYEASSGNNGGNYCTLNPLDISGTSTVSDGNLKASIAAGATNTVSGNFHVTSGQWYWEASITTTAVTCMIGVADGSQPPAERSWQSEGWYYYASNGNKYHDNGSAAYGSSYGQNDIIGIALDMDAGTLTFYKNGVSQGVAYNTGLSGLPITPAVNNGGGTSTHTVVFNFGQRPFEYTPPSNHLSICTQNLSDPTIADSSTAMDVVLYDGDGSTSRDITGLGFASAPDLVWIKNRSTTSDHVLTDSVRGATKELRTNLNSAEVTRTNGLIAFNSDGFEIGNNGSYNSNGQSYVAWSWDGGTSTVTNTDGTHSAQVRANSSTGFSISTHSRVTAASISTWGHGLGAAPEFAILKPYNGAYNWIVWHKSIGYRKRLFLNSTSAGNTYGFDVWSSDSTTLGIYGTIIAGGGTALDCVTYAWAPIEGYSRFGFYEGTGNADGPCVVTGFTPKLIMTKDVDSTSNWNVYDSSRDTYNAADAKLSWNLSSAESTLAAVDFLSNGFKIRTTNADMNENTRTFIWAAWAENPFKNARAK